MELGLRYSTVTLPFWLCTRSILLSAEKASHSPADPINQEAAQGVDEPTALAVLSSVAITKYAPKSGSVAVEFMAARSENGTASVVRNRKLSALPAFPVDAPVQFDSEPVTQLSVLAEYVKGGPPEPDEPFTVTLKFPIAVLLVASVTVTVKLKTPVAVGVPAKSPLVCIAIPVGGVPAEIFQL